MPIHLLVLIHGMWGRPEHLSALDSIIRETHRNSTGTHLEVLVAKTNKDESTYDGIDWGGERVAQEILDEIEQLESDGKKVTRFSVAGYSLGGLLARYVIGILYQKDFFKYVTPVNFSTLATPHLGIPRYPSILSSIFSAVGSKLLSRTGEQFYCVDKWSATGRPLLEVMADPERIFYRALALFKHSSIYANAVNDLTVPYVTAAIETTDPFIEHCTNGIEIEINEDYAPIIKSYSLPPHPPSPTPKPMILTPGWFKMMKPQRPLLPPALQFRFPFNVALYVMLPILIPCLISLALIRLSLASRSSRARIKLLEADSNKQKLFHILRDLEKEVEDAVVELIDDPADPSTVESDSESIPISSAASSIRKPLRNRSKSISNKDKKPQQPILTPTQLQIIANLNKLNLTKQTAFIHPVRNSHAVIVCRDLKRFKAHEVGKGVIRHWADEFVL